MENKIIFSTRANKELALKVSREIGIALGKVEIKDFTSHEIYVNFKSELAGKDIFILGGISLNVNDDLMELFLMVDAAKRAFAKSINSFKLIICKS